MSDMANGTKGVQAYRWLVTIGIALITALSWRQLDQIDKMSVKIEALQIQLTTLASTSEGRSSTPPARRLDTRDRRNDRQDAADRRTAAPAVADRANQEPMMPREINAAGYRLIKEFEAGPLGNSQPALMPYRCPAGRLTNGWGNTHGVRPGVTRSPLPRPRRTLARNLDWAEACVERYATAPNENEFAAMVSLCFNIGPDAGSGFPSSTVLRLHNRGDKAGAAAPSPCGARCAIPAAAAAWLIWRAASPPQHRGQLVSDAGRRSACNADAAVRGAGEVHPVEQDRDRRRPGASPPARRASPIRSVQVAPLLSCITTAGASLEGISEARCTGSCRSWPWLPRRTSCGATSRSAAAARSCRHDRRSPCPGRSRSVPR